MNMGMMIESSLRTRLHVEKKQRSVWSMMKKNPFRVYAPQIEACVSEPPSVRDRRRRREVRLKQHRKKLGERECVCV